MAGFLIMSSVISIVIPTHNRCDLLRETIASLQAQTCRDWEAVVVDDGSTDETMADLQRMAATDARIRPLRRIGSRGGAPVARNQGVLQARGDYVLFLDSDDLLAPTCLEGRLRALQASPQLDFVVFAHDYFEKEVGDQKYIPPPPGRSRSDLERFLKVINPWITSGPLWRRTALGKVGPWDETLPAGQDWEFHVRALIKGLAYVRYAQADWHHRVTGARQTISARMISPEYIAANRAMLARLPVLMQAHGVLTPHLRAVVIGLFFENALTYTHRKYVAEGLQVWQDAARMPELQVHPALRLFVAAILRWQCFRIVQRVTVALMNRLPIYT